VKTVFTCASYSVPPSLKLEIHESHEIHSVKHHVIDCQVLSQPSQDKQRSKAGGTSHTHTHTNIHVRINEANETLIYLLSLSLFTNQTPTLHYSNA